MSNNEIEMELMDDLEDLVSAEDFLDYFSIDFDPSIVHVNRLHILQRFHDYLEAVESRPVEEVELRNLYASMLQKAYSDFVTSDAQTEKVFRVFKSMESAEIMVPLSDLMPGASASASKI